MSNLRLINETAITTANSVSTTNVFTNDFDIYQVTVTDLSSDATAHTNAFLRLVNSSGSVVTTSIYEFARMDMTETGSFGELRGQNQTYMRYLAMAKDQSPEVTALNYYIFNPFSSSSYTFVLQQATGLIANVMRIGKGIGVLEEFSSITGINIGLEESTTNMTSGTIRTYGLRVDS